MALVSLHNETFDLSRISVSEEDHDNTYVEKTTDVELVRNDMELQPAVSSAQNESEPGEVYDLRPQHESMGEIPEMEVDGDNTGLNDVTNHSFHGLDLPSGSVSEYVPDVPDGAMAQSSFMEDVYASLQMDTTCLSPEKLDTQTFEDASLANMSYERGNDVMEDEYKTEIRVLDLVTDVTEPFHDSVATESIEAGRCDNMCVSHDDQHVDQIENNNPINVNEDEVMTSDFMFDDKDVTSISMQHERDNKDSKIFSDVDVKSSPNDGENAGCQDANPDCIMDVQVSPEHTEVQERHHVSLVPYFFQYSCSMLHCCTVNAS